MLRVHRRRLPAVPRRDAALPAVPSLQDILVGLLRLRKVAGPDAQRQPELRGTTSVVRELHVYGTAVAVHARDASKFQHQAGGLGPGAASAHAARPAARPLMRTGCRAG